MQTPHFRHPRQGSGPRSGGFRSSPPAFVRTGAMFPSPPWAFSTPPPTVGPRFGQCSPNTPPREFGGNRGGKYFNSYSPGHTPRRSNPSPRGTPYRHSPYESPGRHSGHQGSPRTSTPFGSTHGRGEGQIIRKSITNHQCSKIPGLTYSPSRSQKLSLNATSNKPQIQAGKGGTTIKTRYI